MEILLILGKFITLLIRFEFPTRTILIMASVVNFSDEGSFKLVMGYLKNKDYASIFRGRNVADTVLIFLIGFSLTHYTTLTTSEISNFDAFLPMIVLGCTLIAGLLFGFVISLILKFISSLRSSIILQILFFIFSTYLVCLFGFLDGKYDYVSEELITVFFGMISNTFIKYNFSKGASGKLKLVIF